MYDASELKMYRVIFEHCPQALVVVDDDGRVLLQNLRTRAMRGLDFAALFRSRCPDVHAFRAQLRVGWLASSEIEVADDQGAARRLSLDGRAHGAFSVVSVRDLSWDSPPSTYPGRARRG
jgi:PAS domain-containing protein